MACRAVAKKRWGIPDSMSLREALLLSSNNFHGDGNALETTDAMTLRENGNSPQVFRGGKCRGRRLYLCININKWEIGNWLPEWRISS